MNDEARNRILELGMTAPSVDNTQPFYFRWDDSRLAIFRDRARDRKRGGAGHYVSMVGLGCLVECLGIAASGEGLAAEVDVTYDPQQLEEPWAMLSFQPNEALADELLQGLRLRCSDRRLYEGGDLSDEVFRRVLADSRRGDGHRLYLQDRPGQELLEYMLECEAFLWEDKYMLPEMLSWVRWSRREAEQTRDGMPWQAMAIGFVTSRLMMLVSKSRLFRRFARRSGGPLRAQQQKLQEQIRSSAALGCFTVRDTRPQSMLHVGRAFLRTWVRLNMAGYGVQVMASPSLHALQHVAGVIPDDYPQESKRLFGRGRAVLTKAFDCRAEEIPAWMFRTGRSSAPPDEMRTLRLPLSDVVS